MSFRPLDGFIDFPVNTLPEDLDMGLKFDYEFAGKKMGDQVSLIISWYMNIVLKTRELPVQDILSMQM